MVGEQGFFTSDRVFAQSGQKLRQNPRGSELKEGIPDPRCGMYWARVETAIGSRGTSATTVRRTGTAMDTYDYASRGQQCAC